LLKKRVRRSINQKWVNPRYLLSSFTWSCFWR